MAENLNGYDQGGDPNWKWVLYYWQLFREWVGLEGEGAVKTAERQKNLEIWREELKEHRKNRDQG